MYFQIETVLEKYGLENCGVSKGRQQLICEKEQELFALKEYFGTEKKAAFMHHLGTYLTENGWLTDYLIKNKDGAFYAEGVDGVKYTLHRWYKGRECDVRNRMEVLVAVSCLARFHKLCQGFDVTDMAVPMAEDPKTTYLRHTRELKKIYQFVIKRKKKNDFEHLYIKCFQDFYGQCQNICQQMECRELDDCAKLHICHGDFHYHNVWFSAGRPVFLQLAKAEYGWQIFDFCNFMRKVLEKNGWDPGLGLAMLEAYNKENPLDEAAFWQMYYKIAFPEKFWKLSNRYYVSNKAWISRQNYEKLQIEIRQNQRRLNYLHRMLYFYENTCQKKVL